MRDRLHWITAETITQEVVTKIIVAALLATPPVLVASCTVYWKRMRLGQDGRELMRRINLSTGRRLRLSDRDKQQRYLCTLSGEVSVVSRDDCNYRLLQRLVKQGVVRHEQVGDEEHFVGVWPSRRA